jgi:NAD(P)H-flavin reductase
LLRSSEGDPGSASQRGLKDTLISRGYFLACQCRPDTDLRIVLGDDENLFARATLLERELVAPRIARLRFDLATPFDFEPGQFVHLRRPDGLVRSYSIASGPDRMDVLELHVGRIDGGRMSNWLLDELALGAVVDIRGPSGNCFYLPGRPEQPLLLIGTGTGLAPLLGIVRAAMAAGHSGEMHLYHGSYEASGLYLVDELRELSARHEPLHYLPCVDRDAPDGFVEGRASDVALGAHRALDGWRVFLCGHPQMVEQTRKLAYLAGASLSDILADPFEIAAS